MWPPRISTVSAAEDRAEDDQQQDREEDGEADRRGVAPEGLLVEAELVADEGEAAHSLGGRLLGRSR